MKKGSNGSNNFENGENKTPTVAVGIDNFESIRQRNTFYIDKTNFIKEWWEQGDQVTLITRPRRFGKTLNMSMVEYFFSNQYAGRGDLFEGLSIWEEEYYRNIQGSYPTIFISFAGVKERNYKDTCYRIKEQIGLLYRKNKDILKDDMFDECDREYYNGISAQMSDVTAATALQRLCDFLSRYYGKKVLILMDEYDTPMQEAYVNGFWDEMTGFIRNLFNNTFKTNPYMERVLMTGITRVSKESVFSDFNNPQIVSTTTNMYTTSFGFTEQEVFDSLDIHGLGEKKQAVKSWYDGFTFGKTTDIYNPWSIICFLREGELKPYWANTSSNSLVGQLVQQGEPELKKSMEDLLEEKTLRTEIDEQIIFEQLNGSVNAVWSLLLASGYLKIVSLEQKKNGEFIYELALTNREVNFMFQKMIQGWFSENKSAYNDFVKAFLIGDKKAMNRFMNRIAISMFSYFDTGKNPSEYAEPEKFYHGFVLGLMVELRDRYVITSNRESGFGRYDVMLQPLEKKDVAIIIEFKVHEPEDESDMQETVAAALHQIEEKNYDADLINRGIKKENIRHYGFAFQGKTVLIG